MEVFAIFRAEKIDQGTETAAHNHNLRASKTKQEKNIDYSSTHKNELLLGTRNTVATINKKVEQRTNKKKLRADANRAIEFVLSASPEHFYDFEAVGMTREEWDNLTPSNFEGRMSEYWDRLNEVKATLKQDKLDDWKKKTVEWVKQEFGGNVVNLVLHLDEKTPHAHLLAVPLTKEGKLSAKDFFTPDTAKRWQDDYAKATGLKRGIASDRKHEDLKAQEFQMARKRGYELGKKEGFEVGHNEGFKEGKREGAKVGYDKYKKVGYEKGKAKGYKAGQEQGLAEARATGAKVGGLLDGLKGAWHAPTKQAQEQHQAELKKAKEAQAKAEEEARQAKNQADNRVTRIADELRTSKGKIAELSDELEQAQEREQTLHKQLNYYKKNAPHLPAPK